MPTKKKKPQNTSNQMLLGQIKRALKDAGIDYSIYRAVTTDSKYLRLDRGVLGSLRIGDHPGKARYHYTYEIGMHIKAFTEKEYGDPGWEFIQYKFPPEDLNGLILQIKLERANKVAKYSQERYTALVKSSKR